MKPRIYKSRHGTDWPWCSTFGLEVAGHRSWEHALAYVARRVYGKGPR